MERVRAKVLLGLSLTKKERAIYLLFIATTEEVRSFLKHEVEYEVK